MSSRDSALIVGFTLIFGGLAAILRGHFTIQFRNGLRLSVTGARAALFGLISLVAALYTLVTLSLADMGGITERSDVIGVLIPLTSVALAVLGFAVAYFFEVRHYRRYQAEHPEMRSKDKPKRGSLTLPYQGAADTDEPIRAETPLQGAIVARLGDDGELIFEEKPAKDESSVS